jgi:hypothetical protein
MKVEYIYEVLADDGVWHIITGFQYAALRCDGSNPASSFRVTAK